MNDDLQAIDASYLPRMRARRLTQISALLVFAFGLSLLSYWTRPKVEVMAVLGCGMLVSALCFGLGRSGRIELGSLLLVVTLAGLMGSLIWTAEGLNDVAVLALPLVLVIAGQLVQGRAFLMMLVAMLGFLFLVALGTANGWRVNSPPSSTWDLWRDLSLVMALGGGVIWFVLDDLRGALVRLERQTSVALESERQARFVSQHDPLTGLPNRMHGRVSIEQAMLQAARSGERVALLFVDLDNFKLINDNLGHTVGDEFLKLVAERLRGCVRSADVVSRHGGDEFVLGLTELQEASSASLVASHVLRELGQPLQVGSHELAAGCSIGVAVFPDDGNSYEELLRKADMAMYQVKADGRNAFRFFDTAMNAAVQHSLWMVSHLRQALVREELSLHYQPIIELRTGRLVGAEALLRWQHPQRGMISPAEFIPAAESSGLIVEIGAWVIHEACRQAVRWQAAGLPPLQVAVNLSPVQFRNGQVAEVVAEALSASGLAPSLLELEITESTFIRDVDRFLDGLQSLKALGVRLSIDDFGTGYSNLAYLQRFAVDKLKIDQSFVRRLLQGPQEQAIVRAIIQMAASLGLSTTAEGIEEGAIQQALAAMGCELGQGYWYARPAPPDDFEAAARMALAA
jgi:diguanylate cyclase (GGDEF)-like protein